MELSPLTAQAARLRFSEPLEQQFRADFFQKSVGTTRLALTLGFVLVAAFGVLDSISAPSVLATFLIIRFGVLCPAIALCIGLTFHRDFHRWMQGTLTFLVPFAGVNITILAALAQPTELAFTTYYAGLILILIWNYTFLRLRFWQAVSAGLLVLAGYEIIALTVQGLGATPTGRAILINNNFFLLSANLIGVFACYFTERYARLDFLQRQALAQEKAKSESLLQKEAEAALRISEAHYRSLIENTNDLIGLLDADGRYIYASPSYERVLGLDPNLILGGSFLALVHPDDRPGLQAKFQSAFQQPGLSLTHEFRTQHRDGTWRILEASGRALPSGLLVSNARDITERKQAEAELQRIQQRFRALFEQSILAVHIRAPNGDHVASNEAIRRLWGIPLDAPIQTHNIFQDAELKERGVIENMQRVFAGESMSLPATWYDPRTNGYPGEPRWVESFHYPVKDEAGQVLEVISLFVDVTPQQEAAKRLHELNVDLERRVVERTAQLTTLRAATEALTATLDAQKIFDVILAKLKEVVPYDSASIQRLTPAGLTIIGGAGFVNPAEVLGMTFELQPGYNPNVDVVHTRQPIILDEMGAKGYRDYALHLHAQTGIRSWLGVPLVFNDVVLGMMTLDKKEPGFYTEAHAQLVLAFGTQAAIAMENARLYTAAQEELAERKRVEAELQSAKEAAEAALAESRRFIAILETTTDFVGMADLQGQSLYLNQAGRRLVGVAETEDITQRPIAGVYPPEVMPQVMHMLETVLRGEVWEGEIMLCHQDGRVFPVSEVTFPLRNAEGQIDTVGTIIRDISTQKQVEAALRESEERLRAVITNAPIVLFALDQSGRFTLSEGRGLEALGLSPSSIIGQSAFDLYQDVPAVVDALRQALAGHIVTDTVQLNELAFESWFAPLRDIQGNVTGVIGVATDVTARMQAIETERVARVQAETLYAVSQTLSATLELHRIFEVILTKLKDVVPYDSATIQVLKAEQVEVVSAVGHPHMEEVIGLRFNITDPRANPNSDVVSSRRPVILDEVAAMRYPDFQGQVHTKSDIRSWLGVPLVFQERVIGLITLDKKQPGFYTNAYARLALAFGAQAAVAIENARLYTALQQELAERARVETALRESEARTRLIVDTALDTIITITSEGDIIGWNPQAEKTFGWSAAEAMGQRLSNTIIPHRYRAAHDAGLKRFLETGIGPILNRVIEIVGLHRDGHEFPVELAISPMPLGGAYIFSAVLRDITERKRVEAALRDSEERFRIIAETSPIPIAITRLSDGLILFANPAFAHLVALPVEQLMGHRSPEFFHDPSERERIIAELQRAGQINNLEFRARRADGTPFWAAISEQTLTFAGEQAVLAALYDISALKDAQAELQQAKDAAEAALAESKRLSAIIETTVDLVGIADLNGRMVYLNRAGRRILGFDEAAPMINYTLQDFFPPAALDTVLNEGIPITVREGTWTTEITFQHQDGHEIPMSFVGIAHRAADGTPQFLSGVARDISERKRFEAELQHAKELADDAREAAEAATRAKSTFLANMSHEIRTPMNAVIGMTSLLLKTNLNEKQHDLVDTIHTAGDTLLTIINDILDFSKIEAGRMELEFKPFNLRQCVESARSLLNPRAHEKGLGFTIALSPEVPAYIVGDITRLRQILLNLIGNAIKFTEQGQVAVTVQLGDATLPTASASDPRRTRPLPLLTVPVSGMCQLHFTVRDTGPGIPTDKMDWLFQSFSQLDASATREYGGTGLGLAISKRLAELMDGIMWAESDGIPGHGSAFHFIIRVPVAEIDHAPGETGRLRLPEAPPLSSVPLGERLPLRLLLAEDVAVNRKFAILALDDLGYTTHIAVNGLEAVQALQTHTYDVIFMDVQMPVLDGLEATRQIRALPGSQPYIIAMTANAMQGDRELCLEAGMNDYVSKPVYLDDLRAALERAGHYLAQHKGTPLASTEAPKPPLPPADLAASPLDPKVLERLARRSNGTELIRLYLTEATEQLRALDTALDRGETATVRNLAHSLKGSSGYVGAQRMASLSAEMEQQAKAGQLTEARLAYARLALALDDTRQAFEKFLGNKEKP